MKIGFPPRTLTALLAVLVLASAQAQSGLAFGVSLNPVDMVANVNATLPLVVTGEAQHAARADVSYAFRDLPAISATYLLRDAEAERVQTYLGAGAGVSFATLTGSTPVLSLHALTGANVDIAGGLGAFGEVVVGGNALAANMRFALGLNYTLGSN